MVLVFILLKLEYGTVFAVALVRIIFKSSFSNLCLLLDIAVKGANLHRG